MHRFQFPTWTNRAVMLLGAAGLFLVCYIVAVAAYATSPGTINVGYSPSQPVAFSHKLHSGELNIDCRYCHNTVDKAAHAAVPATSTCLNCHSAAETDGSTPTSAIHTRSHKLLRVRESQVDDLPIEWLKVHDLPDYAHFDHRAHVNRGIGCVSCHGRVDKMDQITQVEPLSMSWCLDCHRNPEKHLRPLDRITDMTWQSEDQLREGTQLKEELNIHASTNCSTCHR